MELDKKISNRIKGIAIILMIMTHLFALFTNESGFFVVPLFNTGKTLEVVFGQSADICVYLFAFISGYGLCLNYSQRPLKDILFVSLNKLIRFLLSYWLVIFIVFLPFYIINKGQDFEFVELIKTLFGHHGFFSYGWYVYFYILLLLTLPFVSVLLNKNKWLSLAISYLPLFSLYIVLACFKSIVPYYDVICLIIFSYTTALVGYTFGKHSLFDFVFRCFRKRWIIALLSGLIGLSLQIVVFGYFGKGLIQPISVVFIVTFLVAILGTKLPKALFLPLDVLGKNSMNMWYIHYIFFAPYICCYIHSDSWILFSRIASVSLFFAIIISLTLSIPFTLFDTFLIKKVRIH